VNRFKTKDKKTPTFGKQGQQKNILAVPQKGEDFEQSVVIAP